jgi:hypothetical protein
MANVSTEYTRPTGAVLERGRVLAAGCIGRNRRVRMKCGEGRREAAKDSAQWKPRADLQGEYWSVRLVPEISNPERPCLHLGLEVDRTAEGEFENGIVLVEDGQVAAFWPIREVG